MTPAEIAWVARQGGFRGSAVTMAVAVALAESAGNPHAHNARPPDDSYGLWQINMLGGLGPERRASLHLHRDADLFDPVTNARAAYAISDHGHNWRPWSTYDHGNYRAFLAAARRAAAHPVAPSGGRRVVLDLAELTRLATLFQHSADRVEHTRRAIRGLAGDLEPARHRLPEPALAALIGQVMSTMDDPSQLARAAERLTRQGAYAQKVRQLAERADGPDGRWSRADAVRFLHGVGRDVDPYERAIRDVLVGAGVIVRGRTVLGAFGAHTARPVPHQLPTPGVSGLTNGRVPASRLSPVGDGERMTTAAAAEFRRMDAAAGAAGLNLRVNSGYRTYAEQAALYRDYLHGAGALAAPPGRSTHGVGLSADIDVRNPQVGAWLRRHAATYGFVDDVPAEPWHWTYHPH